MAKDTDKVVEEVEDLEVDETEEAETFMTPKELSEELDVDAKRIRAFLRGSEFARAAAEKNTSWRLDEETADAVRAHFADDEDEDLDEEDEASEES
jgi:hypothetical protein